MTNFTDQELRERMMVQRHKRECRNAYQQFFADQQPHALVTLTINQGANRLETNKKNLEKWAYYVDCMANGKPRRVTKLTSEQRLRGWFINEKQETNAHWHGLVLFPEAFTSPWQRLKLSTVFNHIWKKIVAGGNAYTDAIFSSKGASRYCLKENFKGDDFYGSLISLSDFWPASKPERTR